MNVADVILFEIPTFNSSAQCPIVSTWCMVRSAIKSRGQVLVLRGHGPELEDFGTNDGGSNLAIWAK